ncbi:MAG: GTPase Era [Candidatus Dasytiphilus stammeri]
MTLQEKYCGYIPIIGKPNIGKSTLLNKIVGHKISITSNKPHTTRNPIIGIHTDGNYQAIYVDTPGGEVRSDETIIKSQQTNFLNITAASAIIFMVERTSWTENDINICNKLKINMSPVLLVINKIDLIKKKQSLLPYIQFLSTKINCIEIIPISAHTGYNIKNMVNIINNLLPKARHEFAKEDFTDQGHKDRIYEIIREKIMRFLGAELPYIVDIDLEKIFFNQNGNYYIYATIVVGSIGHKKIIIGSKGNKIKKISIAARLDIELIVKSKVIIKLWVKIKKDLKKFIY